MRYSIRLLVLTFALVTFSACDSDSNGGEDFSAPETTRVENIPADPVIGVDPITGRPVGANAFTFYSLRQNRVVTDSSSTEWDIAFKSTTILINGGASGPGNGGAQVLEALFEEVTEAPMEGYSTDSPDAFAIPTGSGEGWYNYNPATNLVSPIPGRVLVIRNADGSFAKLRILSYYQGAPETPTADTPSRYITFEYAYQTDGSRRFE